MGRATMNMPAVPAPAPVQARAHQPSPPDDGLSWDDDELETQIYDNPEEEAAARAAKSSAQSGGKKTNGHGVAAGLAAAAADEPDLSSLVSTAKGWEAPPGVAPAPIRTGPNTPTLLGASSPGITLPPPAGIATGSNQTPTPFGAEEPAFAATLGASSPGAPAWGRQSHRESSAVMRLVDASEPIFDSMAELNAIQKPPRQGIKTSTIVAIAAIVLFLGGVAAVWIATSNSDDGDKTTTAGRSDDPGSGSASDTVVSAGTGSASGTSEAGSGSATVPSTGTAGFDLYVTPANVVAWRLDGAAKSSTLPARINGLSAGRHTVAIDAPPGFMSESREIDLVAGEMAKFEIKLTAVEIIGSFTSEPAGAKVTLVTGGQRIDLGPTPATFKLDPAQKYEVVFEKDGYVSVSKPVQISGQPEEKIAALLEPARVAQKDPNGSGSSRKDPPKDVIKKDPPKDPLPKDPTRDPTPPRDPPKDPPAAKGEGVLSLGAKPPCDIYVNGKSTGLKTPQREIKLPAGRVKITLMNNEYGIKESFTVEIKAGEVTKQVKDYSDRMTPTE